MAAGEYVSVSSQADTETADIQLEQRSLERDFDLEREELASIYRARGLEADLAQQVAQALMDHDALAAHARDEIGISEVQAARPLQAAWSSAAAFTVGAALPLLVATTTPELNQIAMVAAASLVSLALLGGVAARAGGASVAKGAIRVTFWGVLAMTLTAMVGRLFGITA
jgi:VIT1/CCC1 family predicted Fe2+/Mn2+ transporter